MCRLTNDFISFIRLCSHAHTNGVPRGNSFLYFSVKSYNLFSACVSIVSLILRTPLYSAFRAILRVRSKSLDWYILFSCLMMEDCLMFMSDRASRCW